MKSSKRIWRWTMALAPPFVATMVIGCSASDPLGPVVNDQAQAVIANNAVVDVHDVIAPDKAIDASRSTDIDDIIAPDRTSDPNRSLNVNDLQGPQPSENVRGVINDRNDVPGPRGK